MRSEIGSVEAVLEIPRDIRAAMLEHARQEFPSEGCGLLAGPGGRIERFFPMRNADASPLTFRLDPKEQLQVFNLIDDEGWELVAIFHSHTRTEAYPSETDRRQAFYPDAYYLVASLAGSEAPALRGFTIRDGQIEEQEVRIV